MTGYIPAFGERDGGDFMVYGPEGAGTLVDNLYEAFENDRQVRAAGGELDLDKGGDKVTMFDVRHDPAKVILPSQGYRINYGEPSVLISGDTIPPPNVVEVAAFPDPDVLPQVISHHTTPERAGEIFRDANPGMAVYTHCVNGIPGKVDGVSDEELISRTKENFDGAVVLGEDLMVFTIRDNDVEVLDQEALSKR